MRVLFLAEQCDGLPHTWVGVLLARAGIAMRHVLQTGSPVTALLREQGLEVSELPLRSRWDWESVRGLQRVLAEFQPDIIHAYTGKVAWLAIAAQWPRKRCKLVFYRGATRYPSRWVPADWLLFYSRWVDAYDCNCQGVAGYLKAGGVPDGKIAVIHYGHLLDWYQDGALPPALAQKKARFRIGSVRHYRKSKGLETLVDAAGLLAERGLDFECMIVGRDERKQLADYVAKSPARDRIVLPGPIPRPWGLVRTFDCAVLPSVSEGLAKAALEAMACSVPVVASDTGGLSEIVEHNVTGLLVPPQQPDKLAEAIATVLADEERHQRMGAAGHQAISTRFNLATTCKKIQVLYERVLAGQAVNTVAEMR